MGERIDVFISSTSRDLGAYREAVAKVILQLGMFPIDMANFNPTDRNALQLCYDKVQEAAIFIGIYAHRYGYAPDASVTYTAVDGETRTGDDETSITHLEYQWAVERRLPMLLFVVDEDAPWPPKHIEDEPGKSRLKDYKALIGKHYVWGTFSTPDNLATRVATGLAELKSTFPPDKPSQTPKRRDFYKHVNLPPNYVPRHDLLAELRLALLGDENIALTSAIKGATALHGMGGIGKSVMARALCEDTVVQAAYPDGILWASLGQEPDVSAKLREWINALGGIISEGVPSVDSLKAMLAEQLADRTCLLIVDDVWQTKHGDAFRVGGNKCRLLMTTRDAEVARSLGVSITPIPTMSEPEALDLLKQWADGNLADADADILKTIVRELGRLPLALKLAGAQLQGKSPEKWLERFDARKLEAKRGDEDDPHSSLERCFGMSLSELKDAERKLYAALAIFKEDEPIREVAIVRLWAGLDGLDEDEAHDLLDDLAARALLEVVGSEYPRLVSLHDLMRDFIVAELGDSCSTHEILLDTYRKMQIGSGWSYVPDDGYLYDHLVYHLRESNNYIELKALFSTPDWLYSRVSQSGYIYDGFINDLMTTWHNFARREALQQIDTGGDYFAIAECCRYALIRSAINNLAVNYPPELIIRAFERGLQGWTAKRVINLARLVPDPHDRAYFLALLTNTQSISTEDKDEILEDTISAIEEFFTCYLRDIETFSIITQSIGTRLELAKRLVNVIKSEDSEGTRAKAIASVAPYLPESLLDEIIEAVLPLSFDYDHYHSDTAVALQGFVHRLTEEQINHIMDEAISRVANDRDDILEVLSPYLSPEQKEIAKKLHTHPEWLDPNKEHELRESVLEVDISLLDNDIIESAVDELQSGWFFRRSEQNCKLYQIAPHLPPDLLATAVKRVLQNKDMFHPSESRQTGIKILAPYLNTQMQVDIADQIFDWSDDLEIVSILKALAPHLSSRALQTALTNSIQKLEVSSRRNAITVLSPYLEDDLLTVAITSCLQLPISEKLMNAIFSVTSDLSKDNRRHYQQLCLKAIPRLDYAFKSRDVIEQMASFVQNDPEWAIELIQEAIKYDEPAYSRSLVFSVMVKLIDNFSSDCAKHGAVVVTSFFESDLPEFSVFAHAVAIRCKSTFNVDVDFLISRALKIMIDNLDAVSVFDTIKLLGPYLRGDVLDIVLKFARQEEPSGHLPQIFLSIAANLHEIPQWYDEVFTILDDFISGADYAEILIALAPVFGKDGRRLNKALRYARELRFRDLGYQAIAHLAMYLKDETRKHSLLEEVLEFINSLEETDYETARILQRTVETFSQYEDLSETAYQLAIRIKRSDLKAATLASLMSNPFVGNQASIELRRVFVEALLDCQSDQLESVFTLFENVELIDALGLSEQARIQIAQDIVNICLNWKWL